MCQLATRRKRLQLRQAARAGVQIIRALQKGNLRAGRQQAKAQVCSPSEREEAQGVAQAADDADCSPMETAASPSNRWVLVSGQVVHKQLWRLLLFVLIAKAWPVLQAF